MIDQNKLEEIGNKLSGSLVYDDLHKALCKSSYTSDPDNLFPISSNLF